MRITRETALTPATMARRWARRVGTALGLPGAERKALDQLADLAREARGAPEIHRALVRLACESFGAGRAEVVAPANAQEPSRLACWPEAVPPPVPPPRWGAVNVHGHVNVNVNATTQSRERSAPLPTGPAAGPDRRPATLRLPLRAGGVDRGTLVLVTGSRRRGWSAGSVRRLLSLATLTATAEAALAARGAATDWSARDSLTGLPDAAILTAFLEKVLAQSRRGHEPLSLLAIVPDRLATVRETHGPMLADAALQRVARAVVATLREGDMVARVAQDRLLAVLPGAQVSDALSVAEAVRRAIGEAGMAGATTAPMTASIGVAGYPDDADELETLLAAAADALNLARSRGWNRVARPPRCAAGPAAKGQ